MPGYPESAIAFYYIGKVQKLNVDYTPQWGRGSPNKYIDNVTFPRVLTDKRYKYRLVIGGWQSGKDLGVRDGDGVGTDGSQQVNFLEWNSGYGIEDSNTINVYAVDPDNGNQYIVAKWN